MSFLRWIKSDFLNTTEHHLRFPDSHQNWWQLAAIQLTGFVSLPILSASVLILQETNWISAIITLIIGNLILWTIRLAIICMSHEGRKNVLDVSYEYLGRFGSYFIAILLLVSTLAWFVVETTVASDALVRLIPMEGGMGINQFFQIGVLLGILSTLLCMDGMIVLRWFSTLCLPVLFIALLGVLFNASYEIPPQKTHSISLAGLPIFLATNLGVSADLPTFFRHSHSLRSSLNALTAIQLVSLAIGLVGLFLGSIIVPWNGIATTMDFQSASWALKGSLTVLIFLSVIAANVCSVYSASVGWELVAPALAGIKEYLLIGLGASIGFVLITNVFSLNFLEIATGACLVNLCLIFVIAYLLRFVSRRPPATRYEQNTYFIAWFLSSLANMFQIYSGSVSLFWDGLLVILAVIALSFGARFAITKIKKRRRLAE